MSCIFIFRLFFGRKTKFHIRMFYFSAEKEKNHFRSTSTWSNSASLSCKAPQYPIECCTTTSEIAWLRSASRHQLVVPRYRCSKFGCRAFSVTGPMVWNSLPDHLRDPTLGSDCFKSCSKIHLFSLY